MNTLIAIWLLVAAVWALYGTNVQARLSRDRLLDDADPLVAAAGRLWTPWPRLTRRSDRRQLDETETRLREDPERWLHYRRLCQQLSAWNSLESSVALGASAALLALFVGLVD